MVNPAAAPDDEGRILLLHGLLSRHIQRSWLGNVACFQHNPREDSMANIYSISLGCPKNRVDTERLLASVPGASIAPSLEEASCVLINTCGFIDPAIRESIEVIAEAIADIAAMPAETRPLLAVAGCLVGRYGAAVLAPELPEVDLWLDNRALESWSASLCGALASRATKPTPRSKRITPQRIRLLSTGPSYAWLKISDGCDHTCSFCTIPSIRGAFHSTPGDALVREAQELTQAGVRELVVVAQDTTAWGKDFSETAKGTGLITLLARLLPLEGLERLRLLYLYPAGLNDTLLSFLRQAGKPFVPYFDIPVQHAHPDILSRMGRPFARDPRVSIDRVRAHFPEAALRTSVIVGFPGETDAQFQALYDFVEQTRFMHLGAFVYQAEEGTPAAAMPGQIPETIKKERHDAIMALQAGISEELLAPYLGENLDILVDAPHEEWPGLFTGRAWFQAPEIDGVTYISGPGTTPGVSVRAEIVEARTYDLVALT